MLSENVWSVLAKESRVLSEIQETPLFDLVTIAKDTWDGIENTEASAN